MEMDQVFMWWPSTHRFVSREHVRFHRIVIELFMIRNASSTLPWLPNELMFEICRSLFEFYREEARADHHHQHQQQEEEVEHGQGNEGKHSRGCSVQ